MNNLNQNNLQPLFKDATIEFYNKIIIEKSKKKGIGPVIFEINQLKIKVKDQKNFTKGLIAYLVQVNKQLDNVSEDKEFKSWVFQIIAELGTLVYPNTGTCYSLIPQDLKKINWRLLKKKNAKIIKLKGNSFKESKQIPEMFSTFFDEENKYPQTLICIISASLSAEFTHSINQSFININENSMVSEMPIQFKASSWLNRLASGLKHHIIAVNSYKIKNIDETEINPYCKALAVEITNILQNNKLFSNSFYKNQHKLDQKVNVFVWQGSNFLIYPKQLALPMRCYPQDWVINKPSTAESGGFLLSEFTNISYQGYLDSKSFQMHQHTLRINQSIKQINQLQKVEYMINDKMVNFINKYKVELTDADILLITDKWITSNDDTLLSLNKKWGQVYPKKPEEARKAIISERITKRNETLRNQDKLSVTELFNNNPFYWPAVHDFRGRIYRLGNLNIQMDGFARSLICFYSNKPAVSSRKKNKKIFEQFNLLLKEILNDDALIQEWDAVFGNRFINNDAFDKLLFTALKDEKLSLIQVSQLLLLRAKEYDKIGIYYDASASAYQIMGMLNLDEQLCELTNVIGDNVSVEKKDVYEFFKTELNKSDYKNLPFKLDKDASMSALMQNCLTTQMDRELVKAAVMPLIYGKTAYGFSDDLEEFFAKHYLYLSNSPLLKLANFIINQLKTHPTLNRANGFMAFIRDFAKALFDISNVVLVGPYNECTISYHQVTTERLNVYSRKKDAGVQRQRISLNTLKKNEAGVPIRSKTKTVNAFVANFIHFIDGQICHFVVEQFILLGYTNIGTIHDCFYIKPEHKIELQCIYKAGLVMGVLIYELNLAKWADNLIKHHKMPIMQELLDYIHHLENAILRLRKERRNYQMALSDFKQSHIINNEILIAAIGLIQQNGDSKTKTSLHNLLAFLKERDINNYTVILNKLTMKGGNALYSDNK